VRYPSDELHEHDEGQYKNDDAVENRYTDAILAAVGIEQEAQLIVKFGGDEITLR
jgi:hypothetical protein